MKKEYTKPTTLVVDIQPARILCYSNPEGYDDEMN